MAIDITQLMQDLQAAASGSISTDITSLKGFSERQLQAIAEQTKLVAAGIATGDITDATRDYFLSGIKDMTISFAKTLEGLAQVAVENAWNAMVNVLWATISRATGIQINPPA